MLHRAFGAAAGDAGARRCPSAQFCARVVAQLAALYREEPEALATDEELAGAA